MFKCILKFARVVCLVGASVMLVSGRAEAQNDWGSHIQQLLDAHSEQQFGITQALAESAVGPYNGPNNVLSVIAAKGLQVSVVSNATNPLADQIALCIDGLSLLHDQQGHQAVGHQEQNDQQWKHAVLRFGRELKVVQRQIQQVAPFRRPIAAGTPRNAACEPISGANSTSCRRGTYPGRPRCSIGSEVQVACTL